jgi:hypothetical protein
MAKLKAYIRRYLPLSAVIDTLRRRKLALLNPENWDDRNDRLFMQSYKEKRGLSSLYAICVAVRHETYYHWRVFTPGHEGACLELWRGPLEAALRERDSTRFKRGQISHAPPGGAVESQRFREPTVLQAQRL